MNPKFRFVYLFAGMMGLFLLIYEAVDMFPDIDPAIILVIAVPDMLLFFLAYKTYPEEEKSETNVTGEY
jgi:hypothetical protein